MHRVLRLATVGLLAVNVVTVSAQATPQAALPGTAARVTSSAIQGNTLTALSAPLPNATVRLRDVRTGRAIDTTTSDKAGIFVFRRVEPGSYVVELVGNDQTILAASQILNVNTGELVSTIVKLPMRIPMAGLLTKGAPALLAVAAAGAAAGVLASTVTGQPVSPVR
jgi:Carboxypeptidase regulatory-like domain